MSSDVIGLALGGAVDSVKGGSASAYLMMDRAMPPVIVLVLLFVMACGGDPAATDPPSNQRPTIALTIDPESGRAPLTTQISVTCSDTDGSISEYRLDADRQTGFEVEQAEPIDFSLSFDSTTTVRAQCEDDLGSPSSNAFQVVTVHQNQGPTASLTVDPNGGAAPLDVQIDLTCTDPEGSVVSLYELDADGDGKFEVSQERAVSMVQTLNESVLIRAQCTDDEGTTGRPVGQTVVITSPSP
jgi:PKD repeat protein